MHDKQTILLVDNDEQILAGLRLLTRLVAGSPKFKGKILAAADMETAMALLGSVDVDLIVVGGSGRDPLLPQRIVSLQRHCPAALAVALIRDENPGALVEVFVAARCHMCLSTSRGTEELVRIILREAGRLAKEKDRISAALAAEVPGRKFRAWLQPPMKAEAGCRHIEPGAVEMTIG